MWFAAIALGVALAVGYPAFLTLREVIAVFFDDAFYGLQIARNLAHGRGFTFDGLHPTNGFHPLWVLTTVPIFAWWEGDIAPLRAVIVLQSVLAAAAAVQVFVILRPRVPPHVAALASLGLVALPGAAPVFRSGLEASLFACVLSALWGRWMRAVESPDEPRRWLVVGVGCAVAFLVRIETLAIVPALMWLAPVRRWRDRWLIAGPAALTACAYLALNTITFGLPLPVSGMVKSHLMMNDAGFFHWDALLEVPWLGQQIVCRLFGKGSSIYSYGWRAVAAYWAINVVTVALAWRHRQWIVARIRQAGIAFPLAVAVSILAAQKLVTPLIVPWYQVPLYLATASLCAALLPGVRRSVAAGFVALVCLISALAGTAAPRYEYDLAQWLRHNTAETDAIGSWNAGAIGYFAHRRVINLDGLANDARYFNEVVKKKDFRGYWRQQRIRWLADLKGAPGRPYLGIYSSWPDAPGLAASLRLKAEFGGGAETTAVWQVMPQPPL